MINLNIEYYKDNKKIELVLNEYQIYYYRHDKKNQERASISAIDFTDAARIIISKFPLIYYLKIINTKSLRHDTLEKIDNKWLHNSEQEINL